MAKSRQHEIAERVVTELIHRGVVDDREDVTVKVFAPGLAGTRIELEFPAKAADGEEDRDE